MMKWMLAAGAAALAIGSPALAQGHGGGKGHGGQAAGAQQGGGGGGHAAKAQKGGGGGQAARAKQGGGGHAAMAQQGGGHVAKQGGGNRMQFAQQGEARQKGGGGHSQVKAQARGSDRVRMTKVSHDNQVKVRGGGNDRNLAVRVNNDRDLRVARVNRDFDGVRFVPRWNEHGLSSGFIGGCPPGLAKKGNGCLPPGQARKLVGTPLNAALRADTLGWPYREWYRDDNRYMYRWDDDYIYRVNRDNNLIDALFPYANRDYYYYPVGAAYPMDYNYYNVPYQYQSFYPDNGDYLYRYGDGAIYQVNPGSGVINGIAALLTGVPMGIGQPLPPAYDVYNVPLGYRAQYFDTPDAMYRYNDGYIYRVDPTTQLVTAIIRALV